MKNLLTLINFRTFVTVSIYMLASYLTIHYGLKFHQSVILFGLLIVFPLVKSFQFAFKRRERALEYLSSFKGCLIAVHDFFQHSKKLPAEQRAVSMDLLRQASNGLLDCLKTGKPGAKEVHDQINQISLFMQQHRKEISAKTITLVIRSIKEVHISAAFLISLTTHQTVFILRIFAQLFINLFALIQAPTLNYTFEEWPFVIYFLTFFTGLIMITLYNVLDKLEHPFDQSGYDDIKLDEFRLDITQLKTEPEPVLPAETVSVIPPVPDAKQIDEKITPGS